MNDPLEVIREVWAAAVADSPLRHKSAVCLSTIDPDGFPNSRFVDLRAVDERGLMFHTNLQSPKASDLARDSRSSITVFWEHIGVQLRIQGHCTRLGDADDDRYWNARPRDAQLTTLSFQQSEPIAGFDELPKRLQDSREAHYDVSIIDRPDFWGGFVLAPHSVQILQFRSNRLHERTLYSKADGVWSVSLLQP